MELLLTDLDGRASKLRNQHPISRLDAHSYTLPFPVQRTGSDSQHSALIEFLHARLGQEDAAGGLGLGLDPLDQHAVQEGDEGLDGSDSGSL